MQQHILEFGIGNAVVAGVMALCVYGITRIWKNPYLAHGLWILVLVKLITPPLWKVSVPIARACASPVQSVTTADLPQFTPRLATESGQGEMSRPPAQAWRGLTANTAVQPQTVTTDSATQVESSPPWRSMLVLAWAIGSVGWFVVVVWRVVRFNRILSATVPAASGLLRHAESIATALRLKQLPAIRLTKAVIAPMVWPVAWRPVVVLPQQLVQELNSDQLATVIAHEFVHLQRRDHWVRYLETVVNALYWWNPMVWLAQRQLHVAEEACCDAEVVRSFPASTAAYGDALLRTIEFAASGRVPAPALASGFATSHHLKRRVEMILSNEFGRPASRSVRLALIAVSILVMPIAVRTMLADEPTGNSQANELSLEQRVGRIESLLEQLLKRQEESSQSTTQVPGRPSGPPEASTPSSPTPPAVSLPSPPSAVPNSLQLPGRVLPAPHSPAQAPLPGVHRTNVLPAHRLHVRYPTTQQADTGVKSLVDAIKRKQAEIKRLEAEIKEIREALGPESTPSPYSANSR